MGKNLYLGVNDNARKVKKIYMGVGEKARKVKKIYIGVEGKARPCWSSAFDFSYSGNYRFTGSPDGDWAIAFWSSGTLTIRAMPTAIDVFCCGGGGNGGSGTDWNGYGGTHYDGGSGGNGGGCQWKKRVKAGEGSYSVKVGSRGESSAAFDVVGPYGSGGRGGSHGEYNGSSGGNGEYAFGEADFDVPYFGAGYRFGAGGGGGASWWRKDDGQEPHGQPGSGGASGGGRGSYYYPGNVGPTDGAENSGGGGGGGCGPYHTGGGYGASGVVIIRNAR